jgi:signal transduction histidine kinase/ActR/RegA family two-component response regulator
VPSLLPTSLNIDQQAYGPALTQRVNQTKARSMYELMPVSMSIGLVMALGVLAVLHGRVEHQLLLTWFALRVLVATARLVHAGRFMRQGASPQQFSFSSYRLLSALDGLVWGMLGWAITPVTNLEVVVVTLGVLIGVGALGTFMLHVDLTAACLFICPITLPNAVYALSRHDDLGLFCALAVSGLTLALLMEAWRSNLRIAELLRLRVQSEQVAQAQAEALQQAEHLAETRSRFVATMSHEMRTPLHGILGLVRLLRQREVQPQAAHQLDLVRGSGEHLLSVINDVLDFSRMEAGALPTHVAPFNLHQLMAEVLETSQIAATDKRLQLLSQLDFAPHTQVEGDPVRLRQVLHNLLGNAIKFTQAGTVRLSAQRDAGTGAMRIAVHDTGIGIAPAEQARVFEAFHQADGTYQRRFGGTGLGLTISRELCRAMGGDLLCHSEPGQGSVFYVTLPLPEVAVGVGAALMGEGRAGSAAASAHAQANPQALPDTRAAPSPTHAHEHTHHVLLVEDNAVNAIVAEAELHSMGLEVTVMRNGQQAIDWLENRETDLVLMDCEMPELDGFEATRHIRERERATGRKPVRIVALTANGWEAYAKRCLSVGMNDHLAKPFRPDELARTVNRHLHMDFCAS